MQPEVPHLLRLVRAGTARASSPSSRCSPTSTSGCAARTTTSTSSWSAAVSPRCTRRSCRCCARSLPTPRQPHPAQHQRDPTRQGRRAPRRSSHDHRDRVEVYLQYDGQRAETVTASTAAATWCASRSGRSTGCPRPEVFTTLTMTAALGVNDDEIGAVVRRCLDTPYVGGVNVQPVFGSGRGTGIDPLDRLTHAGALTRLGPQTDGLVDWRDLTALPCSHPHCCSVGYLLLDRRGAVAVAGADHRPRPAQGAPRTGQQPDRPSTS